MLCAPLGDRLDIGLAVESVLHMPPVNRASVFSLGFPEHIGHLRHGHVDAVLNEQASNLPAVKGPAAILVELFEHVVDNIV